MKTITKLWILIGTLIALAPLGLIVPAYFGSGPAWGEWGAGEIKELIGYIPAGLQRVASIWNAPMPDYAFRNWDERPLAALSIVYIISASAGILIIVGVVIVLGKFLAKKDKD